MPNACKQGFLILKSDISRMSCSPHLVRGFQVLPLPKVSCITSIKRTLIEKKEERRKKKEERRKKKEENRKFHSKFIAGLIYTS